MFVRPRKDPQRPVLLAAVVRVNADCQHPGQHLGRRAHMKTLRPSLTMAPACERTIQEPMTHVQTAEKAA
jgi:hypothetical protein